MSASRTLYWAITGACQLRCRYCFYEIGMSTRLRSMVDPQNAAAVACSLQSCFDRVVLTGGEPLLNPWLWNIVQSLRSAGLAVSLLTNGLLLDQQCIERIRQLGVSRVYVSLDSLSPTVNDRIRLPPTSTTNTTETIIRNIETLASECLSDTTITILQTICRPSISEIDPMIRFCRRLQLELLIHVAGIPRSSPDTADLRLESASPQELEALENALIRWASNDEGLVRYVRTVVALLGGHPTYSLRCPMGRSAFFLDVDGTLYPCFHRTDRMLGNTRNGRIEQMLLQRNLHELATAPCVSVACACMLE